MHELLKTSKLVCAITRIEVFHFKEGLDHVYLHTNLPNPRAPHIGGLPLHFMCDRGIAKDWVALNYPGVETHTYDHTSGRDVVNGQNPARPLHLQTAEAMSA